MFIKEVIIDGFKSYAHRTVIDGFDPHFNAITGLNGSGKSNILDSICFVLGITNLAHVRAGNLHELVYKQGQAGVNKAVVSIVFDNTDPKASPVGYEQCTEFTVTRQVLIGGKSKYLINGRNAQAGQVADLFHSVQLNVNNPHFLIMQGRITKVLNMKPDEILGMVEEASGTRMYETKRIAALKTISKKQSKLDELNSVLNDEISPTLNRLRGEKTAYLQWSKNQTEIDRNERFVAAYEYTEAKKYLSLNDGEVETMKDQIKNNDNDVEIIKKELLLKDDEISEISSKLNHECASEHKSARSEEEALSKAVVKVTSSWQHKKNESKAARKETEKLKSLILDINNSFKAKEVEIKEELCLIEQKKQESEKKDLELQHLQEEYQNMCAGISSAEDEALPDQISKAHSDANVAASKAKQAKMKINHLTKTLKSTEKELRKQESAVETLTSKKKKLSEKVQDINSRLAHISFSADDYSLLENQKWELENSLRSTQQRIETLTAQLQGRLNFAYSDPVRGFDRLKVKGLIAKLVTVRDVKHSTALEVAAGGKLYQVVVDEAITGKALLERGKLKRRVTIIPLDKIRAHNITNAAIESAKSKARKLGATAYPAIELVGYNEDVRSAVEYVFGSSFIVDGADAANQICNLTKTKTVTLEGDVYDPSGTISGGSSNNLGTVLSKLSEIANSRTELENIQSRLKIVTDKWSSLKSTSKKHGEYSDQLEMVIAELASVEKHLSQTSYGMMLETFNKMKEEVDEAKLEIKIMEEERDMKGNLYKELKEKEEELTQNREKRLKSYDLRLKNAKKSASNALVQYQEGQSKNETLTLELSNMEKEAHDAERAIISSEKSCAQAIADEEVVLQSVEKKKMLYDVAKSALEKVENEISKCSSVVKEQSSAKVKLQEKISTIHIESKKLSVQIAKFYKEKAGGERIISNLCKKHTWIENDQDAFGIVGGDYDFSDADLSSLSKKLTKLKAEQEVLSRKINKKVMGMIEKAEGEYTELVRKRKVVENDKKKIQDVIEQLDIKKKIEIERTWKKVNGDFGSVFSTLLPGAFAKLEPPDGKEVWEGLEVKVAFGGAWKKSLSELSGGQRSLLALSLILSMLLFKPAPMYILDEVDAALDLSHTQNIGNMLKTHFSQSQFLVVSLKEGMFSNANIIFRTKFVDGVSTVSRTMGIGSSSNRKSTPNTNPSQEKSPVRKKRAISRRKNDGKEN
mmetsp:Transcript_48482/g.94766  ORF Transcript_48482/g.94766 Transcript_48482/m.94766 type:complete len:1210 (-) Transcript_48482:291-3920(-)